MQTIGLTALIAFGLVTPAMAAATVPEEYQGVWAAARDCKEKFQNVLSNVVNREFAACRVMQVLSSGHPKSHVNTMYLNCEGSQSREIWHDENIEGTAKRKERCLLPDRLATFLGIRLQIRFLKSS